MELHTAHFFTISWRQIFYRIQTLWNLKMQLFWFILIQGHPHHLLRNSDHIHFAGSNRSPNNQSIQFID